MLWAIDTAYYAAMTTLDIESVTEVSVYTYL